MTMLYGVHAVKPAEITATRVIYSRISDAEQYAKEISSDEGVLAGVVTEFVLNELGHRTPVALFVEGVRQRRPHISNDHQVFSNSHGPWSGWT